MTQMTMFAINEPKTIDELVEAIATLWRLENPDDSEPVPGEIYSVMIDGRAYDVTVERDVFDKSWSDHKEYQPRHLREVNYKDEL